MNGLNEHRVKEWVANTRGYYSRAGKDLKRMIPASGNVKVCLNTV